MSSGLRLRARQVGAVINKNWQIGRQHVTRSLCEALFPMVVMFCVAPLPFLLGLPVFEFIAGDDGDVSVPKLVLPSVSNSGVCSAAPALESLQASRPPGAGEYMPPCFRHLDGSAIAIQCRCRTLLVAAEVDEVIDEFITFLTNSGIVDQIDTFSDAWREEKPGTCPLRVAVERRAFGADVDLYNPDICGLVDFGKDGSSLHITMDSIPDAAVYRATIDRQQDQLENMMMADRCDNLEEMKLPAGCVELYDLYQRHAHANLHLLAGVFLANRVHAAVGTSIHPAFANLAADGMSTIFNLPVPAREITNLGLNRLALSALRSFAFAMVFPFQVWVFRFVSNLIKEREKRLKEGMRMMGLYDSAFYVSWLLWAALRASSVGLIMALEALFLPMSFGNCVFYFFIIVWGVLHTFAMSAVFSTFFSNERTGAMITAMFQFLLMLPSVVRSLQDIPELVISLMVFPSFWMVSALTHVLRAELLGWNNTMVLDGMTIELTLCFGVGVTICWYLLYLYLEQVVPQSVGNHRSPFFLCQMSTYKQVHPSGPVSDSTGPEPSVVGAADAGQDSGSASMASTGVSGCVDGIADATKMKGRLVQVVDDTQLTAKRSAGHCVEVVGLEVIFIGMQGDEIRAVDGLDLVMYPGEIFVLLGHNGAGKTTTIGVLSGLVRATSGAVTIMGYHMPQQTQEIRRSMGVCPQHNVLWDELTCLQHMHFFLALRQAQGTQIATGKVKPELGDMATQMLQEVGLGHRIKYNSSSLSGGMKRKLSVAIAFNDEPTFVILDEPTSGLDPFSRRTMWDFVKARRGDRVILLTTHFMDEAEVLADRIAIMAEGQLRAYGDSQFLKRALGCGYILTITLLEPASGEDSSRETYRAYLTNLISNTFSDVPGLDTGAIGKEVLIRVPFSSSTYLPALLRLLEGCRSGVGDDKMCCVASYGVGVSTLEEVFIKIASGTAIAAKDLDEMVPVAADEETSHADKVTSIRSDASTEITCQERLPVSAAFVDSSLSSSPSLPRVRSTTTESVEFASGVHTYTTNTQNQVRALLGRRVKSSRRDRRSFCLTCCLAPAALCISLATAFILIRTSRDRKQFTVSRDLGASNDPSVFWASSASDAGLPSEIPSIQLSEADLASVDLNRTFPADNRWTAWGEMERGRREEVGGSPVAFNRPTTSSSILPPGSYCKSVNLSRDRCEDRWQRHVILFAERILQTNRSWDAGILRIDGYLTVWANEEARPHAVPIALGALLEQVAGRWLPFSASFLAGKPTFNRQGIFISAEDTMEYFLPVFLVCVAFAFIPASVVQYAMMEKVSGVKGQLLISGCKYTSYWMSNLLWDICFALLPVLTGCLFFVIFQFNHLVEYMDIVIWMMLWFLPAACGFAYCMTFFAESESSATSLVLTGNGTFALTLMIAVVISDFYVASQVFIEIQDGRAGQLGDLDQDDVFVVMILVKEIGAALGYFLPGFALANGLLRIGLRHMLVKIVLPQFVSSNLLDTLSNFMQNAPPAVATQIRVVLELLQETMATNRDGALSEFIDAHILPPFTTALTFQACMFGPTAYGPTNMRIPQTTLPSVLGSTPLIQNATTAFSALQTLSQAVLPNITDTMSQGVLPNITNITNRIEVTDASITYETIGRLAPTTMQIPCNFLLAAPGADPSFGRIGPIIEQATSLFVVGDSMMHIVFLALFWPVMAIVLEAIVQSPSVSRHFVPRDPLPEEPAISPDPDVQLEMERTSTLDKKKQVIFVRNLRRVYKKPSDFVLTFFGLLFIGDLVIFFVILRQTMLVFLAVNVPVVCFTIAMSKHWAHLIYWKTTGPTHAVRGVSWASDTGMVFGLLGVNGAGKTSTFEMMSGMRTPSEGEVSIVGKDIMTQVEACRRYIGYCPQFDCLSPLLGVMDHLYLFGQMKGVSGSDLEHAVDSKLSELKLEKYSHRYAGTLSGGNKRKVSVAIALIGEPPIVFLDEPSTGMDPFARRFMWSVIDDVAERRKQSVVVLTTHSMEEGEALCSRVAIQVDGRFKCLGSIQQVKSRYGTGYEVPIKFKPITADLRSSATKDLREAGFTQDSEDLVSLSFVQALDHGAKSTKFERAQNTGGPFSQPTALVPFLEFVDWWAADYLVSSLREHLSKLAGSDTVQLLEHHGLSARFRLPELRDPDMLPVLFDGLASDTTLNIDDFAVSQSTLEQIFNEFARQANKG